MVRALSDYFEGYYRFDLPVLEDAQCKNAIDPEIFFPTQYDSNRLATRVAKQVCSTCPALVPCREFALDYNIKYGIWGGMTVTERIAFRRLYGYSKPKKPPVGVGFPEEYWGRVTSSSEQAEH